MYIVLAILIFGFLVFIHEGGHFLFARLFRVTVNEFSIGMGPKLISRVSKKSGIRYSWRLFPIGGYVSMAGEDEESDDPNSFTKKPVWQRIIITVAGALTNIVVGILVMFILVASHSQSMASNQIGAFTDGGTVYSENGAAAYGTLYTVQTADGNDLFAEDGTQIYASVIPMESGKNLMTLVRYDSTYMKYVTCDLLGRRVTEAVSFTNEKTPEDPDYRFTDGSKADFSSVRLLTVLKRGMSNEVDSLQVGDVIYSVDGTRTHIYTDASYEIMHVAMKKGKVFYCSNDAGETVAAYLRIDMTVVRDGSKVSLSGVILPTLSSSGVLFGDVDFKVYAERPTIGNIFKQSFFQSFATIKMIWESLIDLVSGRYGVEAVSGPIGVTKTLVSAAKSSLYQLVYIAVVISMNLGIVNLLPIPALDGGKLVFQLIELVFRKPVNRQVEAYIHFAGIVILLLIMVLISLKDVVSLFK